MDYRLNINYENNLLDIDKCKQKINERKFIGKGGQASVYKLESPVCGGTVLKIYHKRTDNNAIYREITILDKVKNLIDKNICPHFIYYYDFEHFKSNDFHIIMEYADGDLNNWTKTTHTDLEWKIFIFQFITGIHAIQKYIKGFHSDLKPKNILFKKINTKKNEYFEYLIDTNKYYLPNNGILFMLADYGSFKSELLDDDPDIINDTIRENRDFEYIKTIVPRIMVNNLEKKYKLDYLLEKLKNNSKFNGYYKTEKAEINKNLKGYSENVKKGFLKRNILYYCLENNIIDYYSEKIDETDKIPSHNIAEFIEKVFNENGPIETILDKYFREFQNINENSKIVQTFNMNS